ncbi:hypothetical protein FACS1894199_10660 [Bacteroidia bacterium]|nr:hypothetical protein FACS1894199_10660 [Bacteroidia bacterium]
MKYSYIFSIILSCCISVEQQKIDVLVVGGSASGTAAGIQAARMGCRTLIIEETTWLGGMLTAAGVSAIDGNERLPAGIFGEFRDSLANYYGGLGALRTGWVSSVLFEPSVGNRIFKNMTYKEPNLTVRFETSLVSIERKQDMWYMTLNSGGKLIQVKAPIVIDATELGDVAKLCGVNYDIGMESSEVTHEAIAPAKANNIVQDLTYVAVLKDYGHDVTIPRPSDYDSTVFACACRNVLCISPKEPDRTLWDVKAMISYGKLPNNKYMINWPLEGNDYYINILEMTAKERKEELQEAKNFTMHFLYFIQHELGLNTLGLADDEYPTADKLPLIPYHRESRRIVGKVRFTLPYITAPYSQALPLYRTNIAVGDYPIDHHHARYKGEEVLPDLHFSPVPSYGLPLGTLIPDGVQGLIVAEKSISVSNIVNGATRLQPVVMQIGQAAGTLAAVAVQKSVDIEKVSVREVQHVILAGNGYLMPYLDVPLGTPLFKVYQRIGATGILKGEGKSEGWSNQTWLRSDAPLLSAELDGLQAIYPNVSLKSLPPVVKTRDALALISEIAYSENRALDDLESRVKQIFAKYELGDVKMNEPIKRGAFAALIDELLEPFSKNVELHGGFR